MRSRKSHNLLPLQTLMLLRIHLVNQWCQWGSMCGETRAECVVGLFRTLWRNGHNFQHSTTLFWRADNGTLHGCSFRSFRTSSAPRKDPIKRRILDHWKFKNNYHRIWGPSENRLPIIAARFDFQVRIGGVEGDEKRRLVIMMLMIQMDQDSHPSCWSCSETFAIFPILPKEGEEVLRA